jgi:hypothetical protein
MRWNWACIQTNFRIFFTRFLIVIFSCFFFQSNLLAVNTDTTYYETFHDQLNLRLYGSRKYTSFIVDQSSAYSYRYRFEPNSTNNLGVGVTYQGLTLNLAYGFGFVNTQTYDVPTRYLDLQAHLYPKNFVIDFFGQFYKGYYLEEIRGNLPLTKYAFPDMNIQKLGFNVQYLFNGEKLSLRAAFQQNERQLRSAGSFLAGVELYRAKIDNIDFLIEPINSQMHFQLGPNVGYVYTLVFLKNFFITTAISTHAGLGYSHLVLDSTPNTKWIINHGVFARGFLGYQHSKWSINVNYIHNRLFLGEVAGFSNELMTGNYRVNFIYRLSKGSGVQHSIDKVLQKAPFR